MTESELVLVLCATLVVAGSVAVVVSVRRWRASRATAGAMIAETPGLPSITAEADILTVETVETRETRETIETIGPGEVTALARRPEAGPLEVRTLMAGIAEGLRRAPGSRQEAALEVKPPQIELDDAGQAIGMSWSARRTAGGRASGGAMPLVSVLHLREGAPSPRVSPVDLSTSSPEATQGLDEPSFGREVEDTFAPFRSGRP